VSQYQKGKTYLDFTEARDSEWRPTNSVKALKAFVDIKSVPKITINSTVNLFF